MPNKSGGAAPPVSRRGVPARTAGGAVLAGTLLLLTACGFLETEGTADAEPRNDPATPPPTGVGDLPHPLEGSALWTAPFSSEPEAAGSSFVGIVQEREGGDLRFLGVDREGVTRWSTERDPSCTGFTVTRGDGGEELVVLLDREPDPDGGLLADRTTAAAHDPDTGEIVWGPTEVPGTLVGPGLVFAALPGSVMSDETGPKVALDAASGDVVADEEDGDAVLHEHHGALLVHRDGELRAVGPEGRDLWTHEDLEVPDGIGEEPVRVGYGPRPASDSGAAVVLEWTPDTDESDGTLLYTVHDLRTGQSLLELDPESEPRYLGDGEGRTAVLGVPAGGDGARLFGLAAPDIPPAWEIPAGADERLSGLVGGMLYTTDGEGRRVVDADTGSAQEGGPDAVPVTALPDGPAILPVPGEDGDDVLAALPVGGGDGT